MATLTHTELETIPAGVAGATAIASANFERLEAMVSPDTDPADAEYSTFARALLKLDATGLAGMVAGDLIRWDGDKFVRVAAGAEGDLLTITSAGAPTYIPRSHLQGWAAYTDAASVATPVAITPATPWDIEVDGYDTRDTQAPYCTDTLWDNVTNRIATNGLTEGAKLFVELEVSIVGTPTPSFADELILKLRLNDAEATEEVVELDRAVILPGTIKLSGFVHLDAAHFDAPAALELHTTAATVSVSVALMTLEVTHYLPIA